MNVKNYGWNSAQAPESCNYLAPAIIRIVERMGASSVLDLGCGNGQLCSGLAKICSHVAGVEYDAHGCEIARSTYPNIPFFNLGVQDEPSEILAQFPERFDAVVSTEVIEHLFFPAQLVSFAGAVLKQDGKLIISTPYHGYLKNLALSAFDKWDKHHTPLWDGGHIKFWSRKTLSELLDREGFTVTHFEGVGRIPLLWKSMIIVARRK